MQHRGPGSAEQRIGRCYASPRERRTASGTPVTGNFEMALARTRRNETGFNYWPGFVDALSTLVLSIVFLLSVFLVVQFFLSQQITGKEKALEELSAKIAQLNDLLSLGTLCELKLNDQLSQLRAGLASTAPDRHPIKAPYHGPTAPANHP